MDLTKLKSYKKSKNGHDFKCNSLPTTKLSMAYYDNKILSIVRRYHNKSSRFLKKF